MIKKISENKSYNYLNNLNFYFIFLHLNEWINIEINFFCFYANEVMALFGHEIGINSNNSLRSAMGKA